MVDIEVLSLGQEEGCTPGAGKVVVGIGQDREAICGAVTLSSGQGWYTSSNNN